MRHLLLAIFSALQIADGVTTWRALRRADRKEGNEIVAWLMEKIGVIPALASLKGLCVGAIAALVWYYPIWQVEAIVGSLCVFYGAVVINNLRKM